MRLVASACVLALALVAQPAQAEPSAWYGWQTLLVDGAAIATVVAGAKASSAGVALAGLSAYALVPPLVHVAHENGISAVASFGLRIGLPLALAATGVATAKPCHSQGDTDDCDGARWNAVGRAAGFGIVGAALAIALDAAVLAREKRPLAPPAPPRARVLVQPILHGGTATLVGTF